jgi:hypothetical protein
MFLLSMYSTVIHIDVLDVFSCSVWPNVWFYFLLILKRNFVGNSGNVTWESRFSTQRSPESSEVCLIFHQNRAHFICWHVGTGNNANNAYRVVSFSNLIEKTTLSLWDLVRRSSFLCAEEKNLLHMLDIWSCCCNDGVLYMHVWCVSYV